MTYKTILFASLIVVAILAFSGIETAESLTIYPGYSNFPSITSEPTLTAGEIQEINKSINLTLENIMGLVHFEIYDEDSKLIEKITTQASYQRKVIITFSIENLESGVYTVHASHYKGVETTTFTIESIRPGVSEIPSWIKNNAGWWVLGIIDDSSFKAGIGFLIEQKSLPDEPIPKIISEDVWKITSLWVNEEIGDSEWLDGISLWLTDKPLWTLNDAKITMYNPEKRYTHVTYDLDYTGNYETCMITLYKSFPEKYGGDYKNISDTHKFKCNEDPNIYSNVHPGETNHYILALQEGFRVTYTEIKLKNFTFELE